MRTKKEPAERPVVISEEHQEFAELVKEVAALEPRHQKIVAVFVHGYAAAVTAGRSEAMI